MLNRKQRRAQKKQSHGEPAESTWRIDGRPVGEAEGKAEWDRVH